ALNYLGYMLADRNVKVAEAQDMVSKALALEPNNGAYLDSLGWVYYRMGKLPEAEETLRQAVSRTGKDPTVHDHLGDVFAKAGKLKEAIGQWEFAVKEYANGSPSDNDPVEVAKLQKKLEGAKVRLAKDKEGTKAAKP
ncbi:MAG: tetratricopeptide repeat protein, partial [Bryobacteraceae bacterium]